MTSFIDQHPNSIQISDYNCYVTVKTNIGVYKTKQVQSSRFKDLIIKILKKWLSKQSLKTKT